MPTVNELKEELRRRGLSAKGNKTELEHRLNDAMAKEASSHQQKRSAVPTEHDAKKPKMTSSGTSSGAAKEADRVFDSLSDCGDTLDAEKTLEFCERLGVDPESRTAIVLSYYLRAPTSGAFERQSFTQGFVALGLKSLEELKAKLPRLEKATVFGASEFDNMYKFVYTWGCEPGIRNMKKEVATGLWKLLIPSSAFSYIDDWLLYWEQSPARVVTKDEWHSFRRFLDIILRDNEIGDSDDAWPSAIDDFVEIIKKKKKQSS